MRRLHAALPGVAVLLLLATGSWLLLRPTPIDAKDEPLLRRALQEAARLERTTPETLRRTRTIAFVRGSRVDCVELRTRRTSVLGDDRFCYGRRSGRLVEERVATGF
jgi:hypothetical protein